MLKYNKWVPDYPFLTGIKDATYSISRYSFVALVRFACINRLHKLILTMKILLFKQQEGLWIKDRFLFSANQSRKRQKREEVRFSFHLSKHFLLLRLESIYEMNLFRYLLMHLSGLEIFYLLAECVRSWRLVWLIKFLIRNKRTRT